MDLERLHDGPDLLADRVRQFEIFHAGTCGNRLEPAAPALASERLKGDVGAAPRRERPKARRLTTKRTDRVRRRGRGNVQGTVNLPVAPARGPTTGILPAVPRARRPVAPRVPPSGPPGSPRAAAPAGGSSARGRLRRPPGGPRGRTTGEPSAFRRSVQEGTRPQRP